MHVEISYVKATLWGFLLNKYIVVYNTCLGSVFLNKM